MRSPEAVGTLQWLAGHGVTPLGPGRWLETDSSGDRELTDNELAHEWADGVLSDDEPAPLDRLRNGLGLLDLVDEYWVTFELNVFLAEQDDPAVTAAFWAGYRQRLERTEPLAQVPYSLWVDWFEDRATVDVAFAAVIGDDVRELREQGRLRELAAGPLHRRAAMVLGHSGPVPWDRKHDVLQAVATVPELAPAVLQALLGGYHDSYGDLEPDAALALLNGLDLPPDTEDLATLRAVLTAGGRRHRDDRDLWDRVQPG
ncbi:hypothetical protein AB0C29_28040 [Actinoplanes sp. NPDC048791]|uniref:hypothetical protein n=1 Tax=Actinoplanes sp. NPDC048791 TaxID=3154623 RepID=UPI0033CC65F1